MRDFPPTLRRRNVAQLKEHRRWLLTRDVDSGNDSNVNSVSGNFGISRSENSADSADETSGDSDNERSVPPARTTPVVEQGVKKPTISQLVTRRRLTERNVNSGTDTDGAPSVNSANSGVSDNDDSVDSDNGNSGFSNSDSDNGKAAPPGRARSTGKPNTARRSISQPMARRRLAERDVNSGSDSDGAPSGNSGNSGVSKSEDSANLGNDNSWISDGDNSGDSDNENRLRPARPTSIGKFQVAKPTISPPVNRKWLIQRGDDDSGSDSGDDADSEDLGDSDVEDPIPPVPQKPNSPPSVSQLSISQLSTSSVLRVSASPTLSPVITLPSIVPAAAAAAFGRGSPPLSQTTPIAAFPTLGPGSTLQVGETVAEPAKEPEEESDSDVDGISSDDGNDSDDDKKTTTGAPAPTPTDTAPSNVQTLTHIVPPNDRKGGSISSPPLVTSAPTTTTRTTLPLSTLPAAQVNPVPITSTVEGTARGTAAGESPGSGFGAQLGIQKTSMSGGEVAGVVIGVLAGVGFLSLLAVFLLRKMHRSDKNPFSRNPSDEDPRPKTFGTTWSRSLWDAASSFAAPKSTVAAPPLPVTANPKTFYNSKTNSEMIDDLVKASYAAENGGANNIKTATYAVNQKLNRQSDLESQFPSSPTSFLNEKAYNALEVWPPYAPPTPVKLKRSSKPPAVTRWLDGILTPRLSRAGGFRPQGTMQGTRWQETGPDGLHGLVPPPPVPGFGKEGGGRGKSGRMTVGTTVTDTTASSVVW